MPSTTRGSILISTANDIGEALVEKLGGVGYSPNEWKEKYNLCGIAPIDSAPALSVLADSAGTGDERGSILIATADAIGAILNKKYNVLRGFKPKEWASACRKMKALEEGSVASASIASFDDGADDVPTKSLLVVTIPPTLSGVSSVTEIQTGRNLVDGTNFTRGLPSTTIGASINTITASTRYAYFGTPIKGGSYTVSSVSNDTDYYNAILIFGYTNSELSFYTNATVNASKTVDLSACDYARIAIGSRTAQITVPTDFTDYGTIQLEYGSTAHAYEPYTTPTTYTASLGRTIYGGEVDIVNGTGTDENGNDFTFDGQEIPTRLGYNAFWSDEGDTAVEYYKAPTPYARKTATGGIANFSDQRTDLPLTKAIANIAPSIAGKSAVNLIRTGASLANIADVSGSMTNQYFYNIGSDYVLTAGTTYKIAMEVNSTVTPFAVSVGVGDDAYRYDIYNTGINNKNGVVAFEFTVEASHLATWNKLWIRAPRYSAPGETSTTTTCTFTVKNITLYSTATTYTAELGETVYGGSVDFVSGEVQKTEKKMMLSELTWSANTNPHIFNGVGFGDRKIAINWSDDDCFSDRYTGYTSTAIIGKEEGIALSTNSQVIYVCDSRFDTVQEFVASLAQSDSAVVLPLATPTESAIPGRVISPIEGVNNYWNDAGGDTEIQYFEDET